jgi:hypothetical protein
MGLGLFPREGGHFVGILFLILNHLDSLIKAGKLDSPIFSFWVAADDTRAELVIGGIDMAKNASEFTWLPVFDHLTHWATTMGPIDVLLDGVSEGTYTFPSDAQVVFDR